MARAVHPKVLLATRKPSPTTRHTETMSCNVRAIPASAAGDAVAVVPSALGSERSVGSDVEEACWDTAGGAGRLRFLDGTLRHYNVDARPRTSARISSYLSRLNEL